ncbi:hypothetical protein LCGC14_0887070 [marine sediment metagenome]|uniref:Uncharacterized protein n=1 Tax=marine sediment metagenome TaxID=412755 RepID=A0A0F9RJR4_9ZZZZ
MKTKYVRVMADYCADGLWDKDGSMIELPCPELNLPDDMLQRLEDWQSWFTKDCQYYIEELKRTIEFDVLAFSIAGLLIAKDIKAYLGEDWTVVYFDDKKYHDTIVDRSVYEYEV